MVKFFLIFLNQLMTFQSNLLWKSKLVQKFLIWSLYIWLLVLLFINLWMLKMLLETCYNLTGIFSVDLSCTINWHIYYRKHPDHKEEQLRTARRPQVLAIECHKKQSNPFYGPPNQNQYQSQPQTRYQQLAQAGRVSELQHFTKKFFSNRVER